MNAVNYDSQMQKTIAELRGAKLLLHSCCAPCSSYCLTQVSDAFKTTVFYYNPNLDGVEEYEKRKNEQIRLLQETGCADFIECGYDHDEFLNAVCGLEAEKEGGARCLKCFRLRLLRTAREAAERGFALFATTLTVSPLKNAAEINRIGFEIEKETGVRYLPSDFKKRGGYLQSIALSKQYGLYRQNYCGCEFSKRENVTDK